MSAQTERPASGRRAWDRLRRPLVVAAAALAVLVVVSAVASWTGGEGAARLLTVVLLLLLLALGAVLLVTGLVWSVAGRSPTPGALVALGGAVLVPFAVLPVLFGGGSPVGATLLTAGLASCWVVAGVVAGQAAPPPAGAVAPRARPAALDRMPGWLLGRGLAVLVLLALLVVGGWWAGQAFTLFPSKETPEDLDRIRRAGAVQLVVMVGGTVLLGAWWALSFRRRAAAVVLVVAGVVGGLFSIVGFAVSLPLVLTAVVLLLLPARPVPAVREAAGAPEARAVDRGPAGTPG